MVSLNISPVVVLAIEYRMVHTPNLGLLNFTLYRW